MEAFIELMMKNLTKNGFPNKRVSFGLERLYELADDRDLSLNKVLDELVARGVAHNKTNEKIIFHQAPPPSEASDFDLSGLDLDALGLGGIDPALLAQAQEMMSKMSPEELASARAMAESQLGGMSEEERAEMLNNMKGS